MQETQVPSLVQEDLLETGNATYSSVLAEYPVDRGAWRAAVHEVSQSEA